VGQLVYQKAVVKPLHHGLRRSVPMARAWGSARSTAHSLAHLALLRDSRPGCAFGRTCDQRPTTYADRAPGPRTKRLGGDWAQGRVHFPRLEVV